LLLELGRPLAANKLIFLWDFAKQYPTIQSFETWAENVKSSLRPQKPATNAAAVSHLPEPSLSEASMSRTGQPYAHNYDDTLKATA
jgi:hypothetical protein